MPQALVDKIIAARNFNAGYDMTELVAAAELDMQWHTLDAERTAAGRRRVREDARSTKARVDLAQVPPRYRSSYFLHIWANGYAAGYYAYLWTQMLADDAFSWFNAHGGLTRDNGDRFRDVVLSRGNTRDYSDDVQGFDGARTGDRPDAEGPGTDTGRRSIAATAGRPNHVVSASAGPPSLPSPTHATYPSGRINTAVGAATTPSAGRSHVPLYRASST